VGGRSEEWSEVAETVLAVNVWSERVFFLLIFFFSNCRAFTLLIPSFPCVNELFE
jgi:hypothetical protein